MRHEYGLCLDRGLLRQVDREHGAGIRGRPVEPAAVRVDQLGRKKLVLAAA